MAFILRVSRIVMYCQHWLAAIEVEGLQTLFREELVAAWVFNILRFVRSQLDVCNERVMVKVETIHLGKWGHYTFIELSLLDISSLEYWGASWKVSWLNCLIRLEELTDREAECILWVPCDQVATLVFMLLTLIYAISNDWSPFS